MSRDKSRPRRVRCVHYLGGGWYDGVPARMLSVDEWLALPEHIREVLERSGLYVVEYEREERIEHDEDN